MSKLGEVARKYPSHAASTDDSNPHVQASFSHLIYPVLHLGGRSGNNRCDARGRIDVYELKTVVEASEK